MAGKTVILDTSVLNRIQQQTGRKAAEVVQKIAQDMEADTKNSFNTVSPAPAGEPPGVVTGNLKNSVVAQPGDNDLTWYVNVYAAYGIHLEYGTMRMAARPFMLPAFERAINRMPNELIKEVVGG